VTSRVGRGCASWRAALAALGTLVCVAVVAGLTAGVAPALAAECQPQPGHEQLRQETEQRRGESSVDPATGKPYSTGLPDCRAYEMVSPLYKQSHDVRPTAWGLAVAPDGETFGFDSEGAFGEPENDDPGFYGISLKYTAQRRASGWVTSSTFAPAKDVVVPTAEDGLDADFPPDLRSSEVSCGITSAGQTADVRNTDYACTMRRAGGEWETSTYAALRNATQTGAGSYVGASSDLSRIFVQPEVPLLEDDLLPKLGARGIYEMTGVGSKSATLRLVNLDNTGNELATAQEEEGFGGPLIGDFRYDEPHVWGTTYHAISDTGETVFFSATDAHSHTRTVFARIACASGPSCKEGRETVAVSNPSLNVSDPGLNAAKSTGSRWECGPTPCATGAEEEAKPATFQGASADGSKVFFTTTQKLLDEKETETLNLYEYDLRPCESKGTPCTPGEAGELVLISRVPDPESEAAEVEGLLRSSSDGGVVYFLARGVLANAAPNKALNEKGEVENQLPKTGDTNLYAYETNLCHPGQAPPCAGNTTENLRFVAAVNINTSEVYSGEGEESVDMNRHAQTTPDGRYLTFSSAGKLAGDANQEAAQGVYRYSVETGELTWISHTAGPGDGETNCAPSRGCTGTKGQTAWVFPLSNRVVGSEADVSDWNRAISGCPDASEAVSESERTSCPQGAYDGEYIIFATREKLQNDDVDNAVNVYEWHCASPCPDPAGEGEVSMISDGDSAAGAGALGGEDYEGAPIAGMSASGSNIFFLTSAALVGQDTDVLRDAYDARVDGGFKAPLTQSCEGETCQGQPSGSSSFGLAASSVVGAGGNLTQQPATSVLSFNVTKPKSLTRAQKLARALKACKGKPRKKRAACEAQARKQYRAKPASERHAASGNNKAKKAQARGRGK